MRLTVILLLVFGLAQPAAAQNASDILREQGLAPAITQLEALADPTPEQSFTLAAAQFLRGIERSLQIRYRHGLTGHGLDLPVLRMAVPVNTSPTPAEPEIYRDLFQQLVDDMADVHATLSRLDDQDFGARIALADPWFDINENGQRDDGEEAARQLGETLLAIPGTPNDLPVVRFDRSDAAWLEAYAHFLSAFSKVVIAFDPTEPTRQTWTSAGVMHGFVLPDIEAGTYDNRTYRWTTTADTVAIVLKTLEQRPDPQVIAEARGHLLQMIALNRVTWERINAETDDDNEWIPSARQTSALGLRVPSETGERWLAVLGDAEALLKGDLLIPHWRLGSQHGINLALLLDDAPPVDLIGWFQGGALLPYAQQGPLITSQNWRLFEFMVRGDGMLFALFLN